MARIFQTPDLQRIIQMALDNNRDLRIANLNIESVQATYGVVRSNLFPTINAAASETKQGVPGAFASFTPRKQFRANLAMASYEIDFFGRLRSLKKSALEDFLASEEARNVTKILVIAETANAYAQLLLDQEMLKVAEENMKAQEARYKYSELRYKQGIDSSVNLMNAQALIETAKANYETYVKLVAQDKNALMVLTGVFNDTSLPQISALSEIKLNENALDFVASQTLLSRPDIQQAEHNLKSANANIGAARAAFFPSITITGSYGYGSRELKTLFDSQFWTFAPQINLPIFTGGRNMANLDIANTRKKIEIAEYEKAIQAAFRETRDQLAEREAIFKQLKSSDKILQARQKSFDVSNLHYQQGEVSAFGILDTQLLLVAAKQNQVVVKKDYLANLIALYKVLGGGSEVEECEEE